MSARPCLVLLLALGACTPERDVQEAALDGVEGPTAPAADAQGSGLDLSAVYSGRRRLQGPVGPDGADGIRRTAARVFFEPLPDGGSVLRLVEEGPEAFRMRFDVPGRASGDGWAGQDGEIQVHIDPQGVLTGTAYEAPFRIVLDGKVSDQRFVLRMDMQATAAAGPLPAGTRFVYDYDLERDAAATDPAAQADDGDRRDTPAAQQGDCRKIRWKLKNVMNYASGTVDLIRVPVCEDK